MQDVYLKVFSSVLIDINNLRHVGRTHTRVSEEGPVQSMPLLAGAGLSHSLVRISIPVPHVTEQVQGLHSPHSPSTGAERSEKTLL